MKWFISFLLLVSLTSCGVNRLSGSFHDSLGSAAESLPFDISSGLSGVDGQLVFGANMVQMYFDNGLNKGEYYMYVDRVLILGDSVIIEGSKHHLKLVIRPSVLIFGASLVEFFSGGRLIWSGVLKGRIITVEE